MIIDQLTPTLSDNLTDEVPVEQGTATFKTTWQKILALFKSNTDASDIASTDGDVQTDIDDLQSDIGDLQSDIDAKANKNGDNITDVGTWVDALAGATITTETTISDIITAASGFTITEIEFIKWGRIAQVRISASKTAAVTSESTMTVATLKSGYRPIISTPAVTNSTTIGYSYLGSNGNVTTRGTWGAAASKVIMATYLLA